MAVLLARPTERPEAYARKDDEDDRGAEQDCQSDAAGDREERRGDDVASGQGHRLGRATRPSRLELGAAPELAKYESPGGTQGIEYEDQCVSHLHMQAGAGEYQE